MRKVNTYQFEIKQSRGRFIHPLRIDATSKKMALEKFEDLTSEMSSGKQKPKPIPVVPGSWDDLVYRSYYSNQLP